MHFFIATAMCFGVKLSKILFDIRYFLDTIKMRNRVKVRIANTKVQLQNNIQVKEEKETVK